MALIYSNFDLLDKPWWRKDYDERNAQYFISEIKRLQQAISLSVGNEDENFWKGYIDLHREHYLNERISTEENVTVQQLLKNSWFEFFKSYIFGPSRFLRLAKKVQNLNNTIICIFPTIFLPNLPMDRFTPSFAKQLHKQIGDGLIDNAGQYRTVGAKPVQDDDDGHVYLDPFLIEDEIVELFRQCQENFGKEELQLEEAIKFGACFLARFLLIHPFSNGNGRVARLLLSYLLSRFTVVPLPLYSGTESRDAFLQCLREAQWYSNKSHSALATFILEKIHLITHEICVKMDINIQNSD